MKTIDGIDFHVLNINPKYLISENGLIYSLFKNRILSPDDNNGYQMVFLKSDPKPKWHYIHRLVACQFLGGLPYDHPLWVNHLDGIKFHNHVSNLEWTTISQNIQHSFDTKIRKPISGKQHWNYGKSPSDHTKSLMSKAKQGEKHPLFKGYFITPLGKFTSALQAANAHNTFSQTIIRRCNSLRYKHLGYSFEPVKA